MRKSLICLFVAGFGILPFGSAQSISVGLKGGISIPNLTAGGSENNPLNTGYSTSLGPDAAIYGEYGITRHLSVELSVEYSSQGGKKNGRQALPVTPDIAALFYPAPAPEYLWADFDAHAKLDYLMIPLLARFGFDLGGRSAWRVYIDAGPFIGFLLSAKTITSGSSNVYIDEGEDTALLTGPTPFDANTDIKDELHKVNWGLAANIGLGYHFNEHSVFVEAGGNYGLINIQKDPADGQNHTGSVNLRIGYAYEFGRKTSSAKSVRSPKVYN